MPSSWTCLHYHIVFGTKNRLPLISPGLAPELYSYIGGIVRNLGGTLLAAGGMADHVHLLCRLGADRAPADLVRDVESSSTRWINERPAVHPLNLAWQAGYGAFTVSESQVPKVLEYIRRQPEHHAHRSFQDEYRAFLIRHGFPAEEGPGALS